MKTPALQFKCYAKGCEKDAVVLVEFNDFGKQTWVGYCAMDGRRPTKANRQKLKPLKKALIFTEQSEGKK